PVQMLLWQVRNRLPRLPPAARPVPRIRSTASDAARGIAGKRRMISSTHFSFGGEEREISTARCWKMSGVSRLWLYHLHYFEDLNATDAEERAPWHAAL